MDDLSVHAITKLNTISLIHTWNITDVYILLYVKCLTSPIFSHKCMDFIGYQICIKSVTRDTWCYLKVGLYFHEDISFDTPLNIVYKYNHSEMQKTRVITSASSKIINGQVEFEFDDIPDDFILECTLTRTTYITKSLYSVEDEEYLKMARTQKVVEKVKNNAPKLISFHALYEDPEFSDMTIYIKGQPFYIHTSILSCYPYFKKLILETKSQGHENIHIDDIETHVFKHILRYIYTGDDKDLQSVACESLSAIKKFGIHTLQTKYIRLLQDELTVDTLMKTLNSVHEINDQNLISFTKTFIRENIINIKESKVYDELKQLYPDIMIQILEDIMTS